MGERGPPPFPRVRQQLAGLLRALAEISPPPERHDRRSGPEPWRSVMTRLRVAKRLRNARRDRGGHGPGTLVRWARPGAAEVPGGAGRWWSGSSQEPTVFNPLRPHIEVDRGVHSASSTASGHGRARPVRPEPRGQVPVGQERWDREERRLEYTFRLKKGVRVARRQALTSRT